MNGPWKILLSLCIKHSAEEKSCYREELEEDMRYIRRRWTNNQENDYNILLYIRFRFGLFICNIPTSVNWILCVHCFIRFIVLTPLQMGLWPDWIKFPYSVFSVVLTTTTTITNNGDLLLIHKWTIHKSTKRAVSASTTSVISCL